MNRDQALKATKHGVIAACISGIATLGFASFAIFSNTDGVLSFMNDPTIFVDVVLIFGCAYGIHRKSRFAAILLFTYFITKVSQKRYASAL